MNLFKRPESVLVIIYTPHGEVLQMRRRNPQDFWQSVTGSLQPNETTRQAALREVREETGFIADHGLTDNGMVNRYPIIKGWTKRFAPGTKENVEHVFSWQLPAIDAVRLNPDEHLEYRWLPRDEAVKLASSATDRDAILKLVPEKSDG
ncbi:MAG: dihydroneopterin triphosphate diphosphatase [Gammaproteobacteria bacterium]|nr:dihydroneopterin triphosphate diphosphatase [Gammaproteobacteria bacterium]MBU6509887.1 dihydroneopterin triphosphate diphosphatase [Gammaproteobacteria bacterium]MDE1984298.1 dihydroneopterin triphosphate diphosphatase [Gammaproteobacteria bacterium]MDE2461734.1 dihydroneopterin triphosphate diphosphatase [Gammaproteobacteria bacterium]